MKRIALMWIVLTGALLVPTAGFAQISCSREGLQRAVDLYIAAQTKGDTSGLPLAMGLGYMENVAPADINKGLIKTPMKIDHQRSLLDTATCQTFTEVIVTDKETAVRPRHAPARQPRQDRRDRNPLDDDGLLALQRRRLPEVFVHREVGRHSRRQARHARHAGRGRQRLPRCVSRREDGPGAVGLPLQPHRRRRMHTGRGAADDSCDVGVPSGVNIANRRFVVDETIGAVVAFCTFGAGSAAGGSGAPDTHLFRVENGKLRYVHTLTHLLQANFRGGGPGAGQRGGAGGPGAAGRGAPPANPQ